MNETRSLPILALRSVLKGLAIVVALTVAGAHPHMVSAEVATDVASYVVYKGERPVLKVIDRPGALTSTALPSPTATPPRHPFLTAAALAPEEENLLRQILDASANTIDFLDNLRRAGYVVRRE
jgi:hypothetical protein